jgi:hypothetical protein
MAIKPLALIFQFTKMFPFKKHWSCHFQFRYQRSHTGLNIFRELAHLLCRFAALFANPTRHISGLSQIQISGISVERKGPLLRLRKT